MLAKNMIHGFCAALAGMAVVGTAMAVEVPNQFSNGQVTNADDVNENFRVLADAINQQATAQQIDLSRYMPNPSLTRLVYKRGYLTERVDPHLPPTEPGACRYWHYARSQNGNTVTDVITVHDADDSFCNDDPDSGWTEIYTIDNAGLHEIREHWLGGTGPDGEPNVVERTYDSDLLRYPRFAAPMQEWASHVIATTTASNPHDPNDASIRKNFMISGKIIKTGAIEVAAGSFNDCVQVHLRYLGALYGVRDHVRWYCADVGKVIEYRSYNDRGHDTLTTELQSYE